MKKEQEELAIELRRLEDENARLRRKLAHIYRLASDATVHAPLLPGRGRPIGSTRVDEKVFAQTLFETYRNLPADQRSKGDVAIALKISRRTLHRYLERWDILWPPTDVESLENVLDRLKAETAPVAAQQARQLASVEPSGVEWMEE